MDDQLPIRFIHIAEPLPGLEEAFQRDREQYVLDAAEVILGYAGRMISASKTDYSRRHPKRFPVFNANVCVEPAQKIWFGDIDLTTDEQQLVELARHLGSRVFVLYERDGRFGGRDDKPLLDRAIYSVTPEGVTELSRGLVRGKDGLLHPEGKR